MQEFWWPRQHIDGKETSVHDLLPPQHRSAVRALDVRLSRRRLFGYAGGLFSLVLFSACGGDDEPQVDDDGAIGESEGSPTLVVDADSTRLTDAGELDDTGSPVTTVAPPAGTASTDDPELQRFLILSRTLTGFEDLGEASLARVYLDHLGDEGEDLDDLYERLGIDENTTDVSMEQLADAGVFEDDALRKLADKITTYWYSGRYEEDGPDDLAVATYITALAWQATEYRLTGPSTCSGPFGNWAEPPVAS